ncbi:hypothetical protein HAP94_09970 [Acidithiobacillus ferrivorans]|nr:hypothetical protein [Acidithiobacillus ferrivorans]
MKKKTINICIGALPATSQVAPYLAQIQELRSIGMQWRFIYDALVAKEKVGDKVKLPVFICAVKSNRYAGVIAQKRLPELDMIFEKVAGVSHAIS